MMIGEGVCEVSLLVRRYRFAHGLERTTVDVV